MNLINQSNGEVSLSWHRRSQIWLLRKDSDDTTLPQTLCSLFPSSSCYVLQHWLHVLTFMNFNATVFNSTIRQLSLWSCHLCLVYLGPRCSSRWMWQCGLTGSGQIRTVITSNGTSARYSFSNALNAGISTNGGSVYNCLRWGSTHLPSKQEHLTVLFH